MGRPPQKKGLELEVVLRLRDPKGRIASEYTIQGQVVQAVNYWPSGLIEDKGTVTLEQFLQEVERMKSEKIA